MVRMRNRLLLVVLVVVGLYIGAIGASAAAEVFGNASGAPAGGAVLNWDGLSVDFQTTQPNVTLRSVAINVDNQHSGDANFGWSVSRWDPGSSSYISVFDGGFTLPAGMTGWIDLPLPGAVTLSEVGEYASYIYYDCVECTSGVSWLTSSTAPSGSSLLQYVGSWDETALQYMTDHLYIEINVEVPTVNPEVCGLAVPDGSVVGEAPNGAQVYYEPGKASPGVILNSGTYIVIGQDATETYYKIKLACQYVWVLKSTMQPSLQAPQNGAPLPTRIVT